MKTTRYRIDTLIEIVCRLTGETREAVLGAIFSEDGTDPILRTALERAEKYHELERCIGVITYAAAISDPCIDDVLVAVIDVVKATT